MSDYIERDKIGLTGFEIVMCNGDYKEALKMLFDKIESIPAADVQPVVRGKWEEVEVIWLTDIRDQPDAIASMFCPKCKRFANHVYHYGDPTHCMNFCPNCGADMKEES